MMEFRTVKCPTCSGLLTPPRAPATDARVILSREIAKHLVGCRDDLWRFFRTLVESRERTASVKLLARELAIIPSTLLARFHRAGLPSPKRYVAYVGFHRAVGEFQDPRLSIKDVAAVLGYSSPHAFSRSVRRDVGIAAAQLRHGHTPESFALLFCERLIVPYVDKLRDFGPLDAVGHRPRSESTASAAV